jgi:hypothetical protein
VALRSLEEQCRAFSLQDAITDLGDLETGVDFGGDTLELSERFETRNEAAQVAVVHRNPAPN